MLLGNRRKVRGDDISHFGFLPPVRFRVFWFYGCYWPWMLHTTMFLVYACNSLGTYFNLLVWIGALESCGTREWCFRDIYKVVYRRMIYMSLSISQIKRNSFVDWRSIAFPEEKRPLHCFAISNHNTINLLKMFHFFLEHIGFKPIFFSDILLYFIASHLHISFLRDLF